MRNLKSATASGMLPILALLCGFGVAVAGPVAASEKDDHDHHDHHEHDDHNDEHREAGAHQHGVAELGVAVEGQKMAIEFSAPAANITGFEHAPKNADQENTVASVMLVLKNGGGLFAMTEAAKCTFSAASVSSPFEQDEAGHDHDHDKSDGEDDVHSDFSARYLFDCAAPKNLTAIQVNLFEKFPSLEKIEAVYLGDNVQLGSDLTPQNASLTVSGQ